MIAECVKCGTKNRVNKTPKDKLPVCGKCGENLPWLVKATDATFDAELDTSILVLVDFWAPWCGPCRTIAPALEAMSKELAGQLKVVKLNIDENPSIQSRYRVMSIPTLKLFKDGKEVDTFVGAMPKGAMMQRIKPHLG